MNEQSFSLNRRISQRKFPLINKGDVITIGFTGININGNPKFPTIREIHPNIHSNNIISYYLNKGR
jgi:hypothetical protein